VSEENRDMAAIMGLDWEAKSKKLAEAEAKVKELKEENEMLWRLQSAAVNFRKLKRFHYKDGLFRDASRKAFRETILMEEKGGE